MPGLTSLRKIRTRNCYYVDKTDLLRRLVEGGDAVLALIERRLPDGWESRYAPVLLETFCETPRFAGTCYRAASKVGATQSRGSTRRECTLPVKDAEAPAPGLAADPQKTSLDERTLTIL